MLQIFCIVIHFICTASMSAPAGMVTCNVKAPAEIRAGQSFEIEVGFNMKEGWYIYAPTKRNGGMMETSISFELPEGFTQTGKINFPEASPHDRYQVFIGRGIKAMQTISSSAKMPSGKYTIKIKVGYQACSSLICLGPEEQQLNADIEIK